MKVNELFEAPDQPKTRSAWEDQADDDHRLLSNAAYVKLIFERASHTAPGEKFTHQTVRKWLKELKEKDPHHLNQGASIERDLASFLKFWEPIKHYFPSR